MTTLPHFKEGAYPDIAVHEAGAREHALVELYEEIREKAIGGLCARYRIDRANAEDILHDAYIKAKQALPNFKGEAKLKTWFFQIVTNTARDWLRRQKVRSAAPLDEFEESSGGDSKPAKLPTGFVGLADQEGTVDLHAALAVVKTWDKVDQTIWHMAEVEDATDTEIAQVTGMNKNTIKTHLRRARMRLRETLRVQVEREAA